MKSDLAWMSDSACENDGSLRHLTQRGIAAIKGRMSRAKLAKIAKLKDQIDLGVWVMGPWRAWRDKILCFRQLRWRANLREPEKFSSIVVHSTLVKAAEISVALQKTGSAFAL
jgi:hypothetical protein